MTVALLVTGCKGEFGAYATEHREVTLVEPGREPRRALTYAMSADRRDAKVSLTVGPLPPDPGSSAAIALTATVAWTRGDRANDRVRYEFRIRDLLPRRDPSMSDDEWKVVGQIYNAFEGVSGRARVSPAGALDLAQTGGVSTLPSWLGLLHLAIVPLPDAPVGVSARWRTRQSITTQDGTRGDETREYELLSIDGEQIAVRMSGQVVFPELTATLSGDLVVKLADALPASAKLKYVLRMELAGEALPSSDEGGMIFIIDR
jgi:hypothetical protein